MRNLNIQALGLKKKKKRGVSVGSLDVCQEGLEMGIKKHSWLREADYIFIKQQRG